MAEHGDSDVVIGEGEEFGAEAVHLVSEGDAEGEGWLPLEEIDGVRTGLYCGEGVSGGAETLRHVEGVPVVLPGNGVLGSESGFGDGFFGRMRGNAAEAELFKIDAVGGAEKGSDVVHAANVVEENGDGKTGHENNVARRALGARSQIEECLMGSTKFSADSAEMAGNFAKASSSP